MIVTFEEHQAEMEEVRVMREDYGMDPLLRLYISFSGGRTSAVMTKRLWEECRDTHDIIITFANTGCEHNETLEFVHKCERTFGWPVVWLEAEVDMRKGKGVRHRVVNYETASRDGRPFHDVVKKYGIFNQTSPACTARTKVDPMRSFLRGHGYVFGRDINHRAAIGIRADEIDRVSVKAIREFGAWYPMVEWGMTKRDVGLEIAKWDFDLEIPGDHFGNCTWCWKKSLRKHLTLARQAPEVFDFPEKMERLHGRDTAHLKKSDDNGDTWWFRNNMSVQDIKDMAATTDFQEYSDDPYKMGWTHDPNGLDRASSCEESCEVFSDENMAYINDEEGDET